MTTLKKLATSAAQQSAHGIIKLLLADHDLLRTLMDKVKSQKATPAQQMNAFAELEKTVTSHVHAEEQTFLSLLAKNPTFDDLVLEGYEEHRVHETVLAGIKKVRDTTRKVQQMKVFCEILDHHLDEEEEKLFPRFKNYAAPSTRKKLGKKFLTARKRTNKTARQRGAARFAA
ncbi:MAG: hemerythrin domain-containing protein [Nitrospiraceae bacterium]